MIGILVATRAEAAMILKPAYGTKKSGIYHYRCKIADRETAIYLTRPGIPSKEQLRRFLRLYPYDAVVSIGTAASLTSEFKYLEPVRVSDPIRVTSVAHLVVSDSDKADIRARTGADLLDMETEIIQKIFAEEEFRKLRLHAIRVVDDLPGEEAYLVKEKLLREMTFQKPNGRLSFAQMIRFGVWDYFHILWRRHRIAQAIARTLNDVLRTLK